ncbi:hypothetical protein JQ594_00905 [Bradyrhizobium manausense]|uniref:hypothetical protein n=1 Tax=Bradyrhizobium manausense TaxID=989370 RepID=UPI001BA8002A|nr:hypothetical protein [Bradyrhizobium manausense]MBR0684459.1 hypothetical protein [Bradyrhizobium manausense]
MSDAAKPNDDGLLEFFQKNGPAPGCADLFLLGENALWLDASIAALLRMFRKGDRPAFASIVVVLPPGNDAGATLIELKRCFLQAWRRYVGSELASDQLERAFRAVGCIVSTSLEAASLVEIVQRAPSGSAFIVTEAAAYRTPDGTASSHISALPEDFWVNHLHSLVALLQAAAEPSLAYVAVDAGEFLPARPEHRDLLHTTRDGLLGIQDPARSPLDLASQFSRWQTTAEDGRVGIVLADIDRQNLPAQNKMLLKAQMLKLVGALPAAKAMMEAQPNLLEGLNSEVALRAAILAEQVDADRLATVLLGKSLPGLRDREFLEASLQLADKLDDRGASEIVEAALSARYPNSTALRLHRAKALVRARRFREAAEAFRDGDAQSQEAADFYGSVAKLTEDDDELDGNRIIAELAQRFPSLRNDATRLVADLLEARGRRPEAIGLLIPTKGADPNPLLLRSAFAMIERGRLVLDSSIDDDVILSVFGSAITWLAGHPLDGDTRIGLLRLLSPEILGSIAIPMMAKLLIDRMAAGVRIRARPKVDDRVPACPPDKLADIMRIGLTTMDARGGAILGKFIYPAERLKEPAEAVVLGLARLVEHLGDRIHDDSDVRTIEACLLMASAIAPLGSEPDEDLVVMRLAAERLALAGRVQRARDLAEQALASGKSSPRRRRLAWFAFADTYARLGNDLEAMIGMACALAADDEATWDQILYETLLLLRILRDIGLLVRARPLIEPARRALRKIGASIRYGDRIDTVELQLDFADYDRDGIVGAERLQRLVERSVSNLRRVLASKDEAEPATILLANMVRLAERQKVEISPVAGQVLEEAMAAGASGIRPLYDALGASDPTITQVAALAARLETARYGDDAGYDVGMLVVAASRLLEATGPVNSTAAFYAIEILADQTVKRPGVSGLSGPPGEPAAPAKAAIEFSRGGVAVVGLGRTEKGLVRVVAMDGELQASCLEPSEVFANDRLLAWQDNYPYGYRDASAYNEFYVSTEGIGVSELPRRAVVIASTDLQGFPTNLLRIGAHLAGAERHLAMAPSLSWLDGARRNPWRGNGQIAAWIPDAVPEEGLPTLAILADRLAGTFADHGVVLSSGFEPPAVKGSDIMIVAAHGGVAEDKRFFRVVTDDVDLALASSTVSGVLEGIGVVVLFVCSGGRLDKHPGASATVGLVRRLLDNGCRAVVAPPWPLRTNVPPYWLPTFLDRWSKSAALIDACFDANCAVRNALGDDPATDLAMTVYGDPLIARSEVRRS